jgi:hypothetical protein
MPRDDGRPALDAYQKPPTPREGSRPTVDATKPPTPREAIQATPRSAASRFGVTGSLRPGVSVAHCFVIHVTVARLEDALARRVRSVRVRYAFPSADTLNELGSAVEVSDSICSVDFKLTFVLAPGSEAQQAVRAGMATKVRSAPRATPQPDVVFELVDAATGAVVGQASYSLMDFIDQSEVGAWAQANSQNM